jgi:hypothetical protein
VISSRALVVPSRLLEVFSSTCLSFFLSFIELSNLHFKRSCECFASPRGAFLYSFCSSAAPDHRGEASVRLRTRLIIASTPLKGQTKVLELAMRMALCQGALQNSANRRPLDFCMVREQGCRLDIAATQEALSICYSSIGTAALYRAPIAARVALGQMPCFNDPVESLARCYAPTQPVTVARCGNFTIKLVFNRCPTLKKPQQISYDPSESWVPTSQSARHKGNQIPMISRRLPCSAVEPGLGDAVKGPLGGHKTPSSAIGTLVSSCRGSQYSACCGLQAMTDSVQPTSPPRGVQ